MLVRKPSTANFQESVVNCGLHFKVALFPDWFKRLSSVYHLHMFLPFLNPREGKAITENRIINDNRHLGEFVKNTYLHSKLIPTGIFRQMLSTPGFQREVSMQKLLLKLLNDYQVTIMVLCEKSKSL